MAIRCKMRLDNVFRQQWGGIKAFFSCSYDEKLAKEDVSFQKATPTGNAEFVIDNPKAAEQLEIGQILLRRFSSSAEAGASVSVFVSVASSKSARVAMPGGAGFCLSRGLGFGRWAFLCHDALLCR